MPDNKQKKGLNKTSVEPEVKRVIQELALKLDVFDYQVVEMALKALARSLSTEPDAGMSDVAAAITGRIQIQLPEALGAQFDAKARAAGVDAGQVLAEFIRRYATEDEIPGAPTRVETAHSHQSQLLDSFADLLAAPDLIPFWEIFRSYVVRTLKVGGWRSKQA